MRIGLASGAVLWAALMLSAGTAHAVDGQVVQTYHLQAGLDVDTAGQVARVELPGEIPAVLNAPAQEAIKHWRFKPPVREGHAVTARTYAWVDLVLVKRPDGNYGVAVRYVKNGPALALRAPRWPMEQGDGRLTMAATVQPDGSLTDIKLVDSEFSSPLARKQFALAVQEAIRHSRALPELVDGKPVATRMQIPVTFRTRNPSGVAEAEANRPKDPAADARETPDLSGQAVALDSPVQPLMVEPRG
jgi:hypothetical protein